LSDLLVIEFPIEAEGVREMLLAMQREYLIESEDRVLAVKDDRGRVKLNQLFQADAQGAVPGMLWGSLIGLLFMMRCPLLRLVPRRTQKPARRSRHQRRLC
jgi:uncharacterized membrane protein